MSRSSERFWAFTRSAATAERVTERTSSGGVGVNHAIVHILPESADAI